MASGIARPAGRKKSPRHEYRGLVDQFPPVRIVDGEPRCVSSRDEAGCVIGRDITATIVLPRLPASNRDKIFPIFFSTSGRRLLRRRTMPLAKLSSEIEFLGDGEDVAEINIYGETALADLFDERGINKVSINV